MSRTILTGLLLCSLLLGCAGAMGKKKDVIVYSANATLNTITEHYATTAKIAPERLAPGVLPDAALRDKATDSAMKPLLRKFIANSPLVKVSTLPPASPTANFFQIYGPTANGPDAETDEWTQEFFFRADFCNSLSLAGIITGFAKNQVVAGDKDIAAVKLFDPKLTVLPPAYLLIAKHIDNTPDTYRIIGTAKTVQNMGVDVQIEIIEAASEIYAGDIVFIVPVKGEIVPGKDAAQSATPNREEITVTPVKEQAAPKQPVIQK